MKKTTHLVIVLLLSSYYTFSQAGMDTTNPLNQLDSTDLTIGLSNYGTDIVTETDVFPMKLESARDIVEKSFNDTRAFMFTSASDYANRIHTDDALVSKNATLARTDNRTKFRYYKNAGNYFVEFILGTNLHLYFC